VEADQIEAVLGDCESALADGRPGDVRGLGFWRIVGQIKRDPELVERFADQVAGLDQGLFRAWAPLTVPLGAGTVVMAVATAAGLVPIAAAYRLGTPWNGLWFLAGMGILLVTTHGLGHLVVGRAVGIHFTAWFIGSRRPQPGVKTDYASYLRTPARSRAWMHASGALVTKAVPFLLVPSALIAGIPGWAVAVLLAVGAVQILTDVVWSVTASDWKRYRREMRIARAS
jgi:hypothetical protein